MPIIAGRASAAYGAGFAATIPEIPFAVAGSYDALSTVTVPSGGVASITFAAIPTGYKHLQVRWIARTNRAATNGDFMVMRFNNISASASYYGQHALYGNGQSAVAGADGTHTGIYIERTSSANMTANIFGVGIIDILDYQDTNKNKVIRAFAGLEANSGDTTSNVRLASGMLLTAPAITSVSFIPGTGSSFVEHSSLTLYGVR